MHKTLIETQGYDLYHNGAINGLIVSWIGIHLPVNGSLACAQDMCFI
jgi:hypothetical protein